MSVHVRGGDSECTCEREIVIVSAYLCDREKLRVCMYVRRGECMYARGRKCARARERVCVCMCKRE